LLIPPLIEDGDIKKIKLDVIDPSDKDPLDWTTDQLVAFLYGSPAVGSLRRPDVSFKATLRDNKIDGEVLLKKVDNDVLQRDLGLSPFGERIWVLDVIRYLQEKSGKYQAANAQGKLLSFIPYSKH
jgi:hypothetical protein